MKNLLLIDNDKNALAALSSALNQQKFTVSSALNCEDGLNLALAEQPDLVLLEIMKGKLDSFALLDKIKHDDATRRIPVIVLTSHADPKYVARAIKLGAADYYIKSSDWGSIMKKLRAVFDLDHES